MKIIFPERYKFFEKSIEKFFIFYFYAPRQYLVKHTKSYWKSDRGQLLPVRVIRSPWIYRK